MKIGSKIWLGRQNCLSSSKTQRWQTNVRAFTTKEMLAEIYKYSKKEQRSVTLKQLEGMDYDNNNNNNNKLEYGINRSSKSLLNMASWLHQELPIRLSVQVASLEKLPYGMCLMPSVKKVREWYVQSFEELYKFPKLRSEADEKAFFELVNNIYSRHSPTMFMMARGVHELKAEISKSFFNGKESADVWGYVEIHRFLDNFYLSRIGIRTLIGQYLALHETQEPGFVGVICRKTSPRKVIQSAIDDAQYMCSRNHGEAPDVKILGGEDTTLPFIPSYLYYMTFELLKNSMRAVVEFHNQSHSKPPVEVIIADDEEDLSIKISDRGGGIRKSDMPKIWSYLYTTAPFSLDSLDASPDFNKQAPLAGLGYGLPVSRLFARYCGGDLQLVSMAKYGADAFIHLNRNGDKEEPLPKLKSPKVLVT